MTMMSGLGIVLSLVFGCLLLALVAELYYLLWWKRQSIITGSNSQRIEDDYSNHTKEMFYLFCWDKQPSSVIINRNNNNSNNPIVANPCDVNNEHDPDLEMGLGTSRKDLLLRSLGEEGVESELMRLHNLAGPPRFLFTIKEETKEDLESEDGRSKRGSRTRSLGDLIVSLDAQSPFLMSPMASPPLFGVANNNNNNYDNPLYESSLEAAELLRLRSSPPPKFKFLRDAEEKLYRRLVEEAQRKSGVLLQEIVLGNSERPATDEEKHGSLMKSGDIVDNGLVKNKDMDAIHCASQVLPLASSPPLDHSQLSSVENKPCLR